MPRPAAPLSRVTIGGLSLSTTAGLIAVMALAAPPADDPAVPASDLGATTDGAAAAGAVSATTSPLPDPGAVAEAAGVATPDVTIIVRHHVVPAEGAAVVSQPGPATPSRRPSTNPGPSTSSAAAAGPAAPAPEVAASPPPTSPPATSPPATVAPSPPATDPPRSSGSK